MCLDFRLLKVKVIYNNAGYSGTPGDYDSLVAYMKQVKEYQKEHNEKSPEIKPKPLPKQLEEDNQAQTKELEWIKDLRKKIDDIINKFNNADKTYRANTQTR